MMPLQGHANEEASSASDGPSQKRPRSDNNCHQCHRNDKGRTVRCTRCDRKNYCVRCITRWYPNMNETDIIEACPSCRSICNCLRCLQFHGVYEDFPIPGFKLSTEYMIQQSSHVVRVLIPSLKQLVLEQDMETEEESRIQGLSIRRLQLPKVNDNHNYKLQCNNCKTSIFDIHRSCPNCSYKLCVTCCRELRDASSQGSGSSWVSNVNLVSGWKVTEKGNIACLPEDVGGCGESNLELNSIYPSNWLSQLLMKAEAIAKVGYSDAFGDSEGARSCLRSNPGNESGSETLCRAASREENVDNYSHFRWHLCNGEPVNVPNVLSGTFGLSWEPMVMWRACRKPRQTDQSRILDINALNCLNWSEESLNMRQFFKGYTGGLSDSEGRVKILALQDWPPAEPFEERLPRHFTEFMRCLPFTHYTNPQAGELNLAAKLPKMLLKPDLGPKMWINYGVDQEHGFDSVTNLHYAASDRISVMMHTTARRVEVPPDPMETSVSNERTNEAVERNQHGESEESNKEYPSISSYQEQGFDDGEGGAIWDIFRRQDVPELEDYLKKHFWEFRRVFPMQQMVHPIHEKAFYLTVEHKRKLKEEYGIEPKSFVLRQGDALIIPAGCPYQARYLKSCTSVAVNFVSPEGVGECLRLSEEYRSLPRNHRFKEDKLQVRQIILHAISQSVQYLDTAIAKTTRSVLELLSVPTNVNNNPTEPEHKPAFELMKEQLEMMKSGLQKEGHALPTDVRTELEQRIRDLHERIVSRPGPSSQ